MREMLFKGSDTIYLGSWTATDTNYPLAVGNLLNYYDSNDDGNISRSEVFAAIGGVVHQTTIFQNCGANLSYKPAHFDKWYGTPYEVVADYTIAELSAGTIRRQVYTEWTLEALYEYPDGAGHYGVCARYSRKWWIESYEGE